MPDYLNPVTARGPKALLDDYAAIARRRGPVTVEQTALRVRSVTYRDLIAHVASDGLLTYNELLDDSANLKAVVDPAWMAALGRVIGLQQFFPEDSRQAIYLLSEFVGKLPDSLQSYYAKLLVELLYSTHQYRWAHEILLSYPDVQRIGDGYLMTDLYNPFTRSPYAHMERWRGGLARRFNSHDLTAPDIDLGAAIPFNGLSATRTLPTVDGPLISVVMTTFRPESHALRNSIDSILAQTWENLELIIVDDGSPPEYRELLTQLTSLDSRIHTLSMSHNQGTYLARNAGIAIAKGEFITGQDDDDWAHPERLHRQVYPLLDSIEAVATRSNAITALDNLIMQRPGYRPVQPNTSSLMYRLAVVRKLGGYIAARRASDSELLHRVERYTGRTCIDVKSPLGIIRIDPGSLSRSDFRAGWHHPARRAYRDSYMHWHATAQIKELEISTSSPATVSIPDRFKIELSGTSAIDVVLAGDWRQYGGPQKSMIEEIRALTSRNLTVGVLHLEAARFMSKTPKPLCTPIQEMINNGTVKRICDDDDVKVRLVVLRYPPILQFPPVEPLGIRAERLIILANQAPAERDGSDIRYDVRACSENAEHLFRLRGLWAPQGPTVRHAIESLVCDQELADFDIPGILDIDEWATERRGFRSNRPVVGRHSRDNPMKWPGDSATLRSVYPIDGQMDIRVMGGHKTPLSVLGADSLPASWVSFPKDHLDVRTFLNSLDFFVYYQNEHAYDAFGRSTLEALATGCVAILPPHLEATFGEAAVYADPENARAAVKRLYADPVAYRQQSARAIAHVRQKFSHDAHVSLIQELLRRERLTPWADGAPRAD